MARRLMATLIALGAILLCTNPASATPAPPSWLVTVSTTLAERNGDDLPLWGRYVATTRRAALHAIGVNNVSSQPVYAVVLRGQFTEQAPYTTQRPVPPTGAFITVLISISSHRVLDYRLGDRAPNLAMLRSVRALPFQSAGLRPPAIAPRQLVARYFADLNAHRAYAAYLLEATCQTDFIDPNGPGEPAGSGGFGARGVWNGHASPRPPILRAAHVTGIHQFHDPILTRNHFLGFDVGVWLRFDYPPVSSGFAGNNERPSGHHVVKVILHSCDRRWGIDPGWLGSGGPWNWR